MTAPRWTDIQPLLDEALDLPTQERPAFLDARCAGRPEWRAEIEAYLDLEDDATDLLETPLIDLLAGRAPELREGEVLGPYRLGEILARGGMGVIYRANRVDGAYSQDVAVKVLKRGLDTGEIVRRFHREREILASLDHPHIVRILDGGSTEDGLPYYVMAHVEGVRIDTWCERHGLGTAARVELMLQVCEAVHVAHQSLVVHCDLKPSNLLVANDGSPRLLDFGISKLLRPSLEGATVTALGMRFGSRGYASPEQSRGEAITTASDVYSLGVVLRELVSEESQALRGDLAAIVAKATREEAERRYASAAEMAEDLRRHLARLPVRARRDTALYHAVRLVQRRPLAVAATFILLMTLLLSAVAAERAWRQRTRADEIRGAYLELLEAIDPTGNEAGASAARSALERALGTELVGDPSDHALLLDRIGRIYYRFGLLDDARDLLERALALRRATPGDPAALADSLHNLALVLLQSGADAEGRELLSEALALEQESGVRGASWLDRMSTLGLALRNEGNLVEAEQVFRDVLPLLRKAYGEDSLEVAKGLNNHAQVLRELNRLEEAEPLLRESLRLREERFGPDHLHVAVALANLGALLTAQQKLELAIAAYDRALEIRESHADDEGLPLALTRAGLGFALLERGLPKDLERAEALLRAAESVFVRQAAETSHYTQVARRNLAAVLLAQGRGDAAEDLAARVVKSAAETWPEGHWRLADSRCVLGASRGALGHDDEALDLLRACLPEVEEGAGVSSPYARAARRWLAALEEE